MTVCVAGKNEIAIRGLSYLLKNFGHHQLLACINRNDDALNGWQPSFKLFCSKVGVQIVEIEDLYEIEELLLITLEYDRIIKPAKFKSKRLFNIHFSKLPSYKGMFTSILPLLDGKAESGVTLHAIDKGIDTGAIVDQIVFPLSIDLNSRQLYDLYLMNSYSLFERNILKLLADEQVSIPQQNQESTYFSKYTLDFSNLRVELNKTCFQIHNQVRAYAFRDYQLPIVFDQTIYKSSQTLDVSEGKPGSIKYKDEFKIICNTVDYDVILYIDKADELFLACKTGDLATIETLLSQEYQINVRTPQGWDALIVAAYHNQFELVDYLINRLEWDVNTSNFKGTTALMYAMSAACEGKGMESLRLLYPISDRTKRDDQDKDLYEYAKQYNNGEVLRYFEKPNNII